MPPNYTLRRTQRLYGELLLELGKDRNIDWNLEKSPPPSSALTGHQQCQLPSLVVMVHLAQKRVHVRLSWALALFSAWPPCPLPLFLPPSPLALPQTHEDPPVKYPLSHSA